MRVARAHVRSAPRRRDSPRRRDDEGGHACPHSRSSRPATADVGHTGMRAQRGLDALRADVLAAADDQVARAGPRPRGSPRRRGGRGRRCAASRRRRAAGATVGPRTRISPSSIADLRPGQRPARRPARSRRLGRGRACRPASRPRSGRRSGRRWRPVRSPPRGRRAETGPPPISSRRGRVDGGARVEQADELGRHQRDDASRRRRSSVVGHAIDVEAGRGSPRRSRRSPTGSGSSARRRG